MGNKQNYSSELRKQSQGQIAMLSIAFLLGMAVSLIGLPSEVEGASKALTNISLGLHILIGFGLMFGALRVIKTARKINAKQKQLAYSGAASVIISFVSGILTLVTDNNWWSYLMAVGFIAALLLYGTLFSKQDN